MKSRALVCALAIGLALSQVGHHAQAAPPDRRYVPNEVLIKFRDGTTATQQTTAHSAIQATRREVIHAQSNGTARLELVGLPVGTDVQETIATLKTDPTVEYAEPNWIYTHGATSNDPFFTNGSLWGMYGDQTSPANQYGSQAGEAWAAGQTGSSNVYIGVIDEGIQFTHPDLDANIWTNPFDAADGIDNDGNGYVDDIHGWDFANNDNSIYDGGTQGRLDNHGTHVSGTIGGEGGNATGVAGINWNVRIISGKFLGRNGGTTANAIKAVDYMTNLKINRGLNIVATSNSWGGGGFSQALFDAIERANAAGILFIVAAGNSGVNIDSSPSYPASYTNANIISVAAIDSAGAIASFSNYGATDVDIGAPGVAINSTVAFNSYASYNGTSMATPHVSGAAALYASAHPGATAAQIKNAILSSAIPTASLAGKTSTGGRLDANAALSR